MSATPADQPAGPQPSTPAAAGTPGAPPVPPGPPVPDFKDVYPYLNPPVWDGKSSCICRPLMTQDKMPIVSFGRDMTHGLAMIMLRTACEEGYTIAKLEQEAMKNLVSRADRAEWQTNEVEWDGGTRTIYWRSGDERTASDLLDSEFLAEMHRTMDCQDVAVGVPVNNMMMACPRDMEEGLSRVIKQQYADMQSAGQEVLTPHLLSVMDGRLCGFLEAEEVTEDFPGPEPDAS